MKLLGNTKKPLKQLEKNTQSFVNLKELIYNNLQLYGFVAHKTLINSEFDIVASAYNTTLYLLTIDLPKDHKFSTKIISPEQKLFFQRLVNKGVECGIAIRIVEGAIFYLPYSLVVASGEKELEIITTQLDLLKTHLGKWRTQYENYNYKRD